MNTKKDFERAAKIVKDTRVLNQLEKKFAVGLFIKFFREDNPKFNSERFIQACGIEE